MNRTPRPWTGMDYLLATAVMGLMGLFYWAIRGTTGYGGETGGMLAGFGWALIWYGFSQCGEGAERRPYGHPWILLAIACGIAFGGFTGYGVYISWLNGRFFLNHPEMERAVPAWTGYAMLFACGFHWGGNTGCFMSWCAPVRPMRGRDWAFRIFCGVAGALAAAWFVRVFPQLFLPYYAEGLYDVPEYKTCQRALNSIRNIAPHVGSVLGFLAYEIARRDRRAVAMILTVAIGFAIPFTIGGYWQTLHGSSLKLDWWKNWEMTIGLGGGLSLGLAFWLFNHPGDTLQFTLGPKARAFFRSGIPLWFPSISVLQGLYDGLCEIHGYASTYTGYLLLLALSVVPFIAAWRWRISKGGATASPYRVRFSLIVVLQLFIIVSGYLVSIPVHWRLANYFLVSIYSLAILLSLICTGVLWRNKALAVSGKKAV